MRLNAKNNAETRLAEPVGESDTSIVVEDASVLPEAPYRLSIGDEILEVTGANGNTLTVDRAVEGTVASSHDEGMAVENRFTAGYYDGIENNLSEHEGKIASDSELGHVKVDNDTIKISNNGVISTTSSGGGDIPNISLESYNELTHSNGHEGQLYYIKVGNLVHIIGELGGGGETATVGTLPTGYRPVKDITSVYADYTNTRLTLYNITVKENGAVWRTRKFVEDEVESLIDINIVYLAKTE